MNENVFFREATLRVCGSLDIEAGLYELHKLLSDLMPVAKMYLQYYEPEQKAMRSIAFVSDKEYKKTDLLVKLSEEASRLSANTPTDQDAFLLKDPSRFPVSKEMSRFHSIKPSSVMILALRVDENMLGFLVLTSEGKDIFTNDHIKWISLLKSPLSIAMSNTLRHRNELKLFNRDFFFEVTMRICGNLKIEKALAESLAYISQYIPADKIYLERYEGDLMSMRVIARASSEGSEAMNFMVPLPESSEEKMKQVKEQFLKGELPPVFVINDSEKEPVTQNMLKVLKEPISSAMSMPLYVKGHVAGTVVLLAEGKNRYTEEDAKLFSCLKSPFYIAMSNALLYQNELRLADRDFFFEVTKRVCGNLDFDKALYETTKYLREEMPVDLMFLQIFDPGMKAMKIIAIATPEEGKVTNSYTPLSAEAIAEMHEFGKELKKTGPNHVWLFDDNPLDQILTREISESNKIPVTSIMVMPLGLTDPKKLVGMGSIVLTTAGEEKFTAKHAELLSLLKEPFAIAMYNALKHSEITKLKDLLADDNRYLQGELRRMHGEKIIGEDFGLKEVMFKVQQVAKMESPVLLLGETGTGKDVIANTIHLSSLRSKGPFVSVNCGAIPESLIDSELFGHEKGAFTGALSQKRGRFERADGGTIFLDEIGELPLQAQVRLLRVLQNREIERIGGNKTIKLDIRIIAATNRDMREMIKEKLFREDLWFRLNVFPIDIPPLRKRKSDIPALIQHFIQQKSKDLKLPTIPELAPAAIDHLLAYDWPGNVRELENIIERILILNPQGPIRFDQLGFELPEEEEYSDIKLDDVVTIHIKKILKQTNGKINGSDGAAELLGVNPNTLRNRMLKLGINYQKKR